MERPHASIIIVVGGNERAGVVGDAVDHADLRNDVDRRRIARARASPSASSPAVSVPFLRSHSAIPRRPSSIRRRWAAVSASQALTVVPSCAAAWSIRVGEVGR